MPGRSYKLKMCIGGSSGSGKTSFLLGKGQIDYEFNHLGVSFKPVECIVNEGDCYKFVVWDLKVKERFRFLYPVFCRGASGAFICFDTSNRSSFEEIPYWVKVFRNNGYNLEKKIPIILIGTKTDLPQQEFTEEEVISLVEEYDLDGIFYTSVYDNNIKEKKENIFKNFIEKIEPFYQIHDVAIFIPKEDETFKNFVKFFSVCPVCNKSNHFESLKNFFYSRDPVMVNLRERLLELINDSKNFEDIYFNKIKLGIPCCGCFSELFEVKDGTS